LKVEAVKRLLEIKTDNQLGEIFTKLGTEAQICKSQKSEKHQLFHFETNCDQELCSNTRICIGLARRDHMIPWHIRSQCKEMVVVIEWGRKGNNHKNDRFSAR
jgi:hypothetical protein